MIYAHPNTSGAPLKFKAKYDNFIGGKWVAPTKGVYFDVVTPITGKPYTQAARSSAEDIELALDAAHAAADRWGKTSAAERGNILLKIADRLEANLELLAYAETVDNGKPIRETLNADIPLAIDHFRYFAGCVRSQEGGISEIDENTMAYHIHEPLGVVGQIIPWNFPILMAAWKLAPALAAGNCVILKPAEQTPISILVLVELIADLLPAGALNIVNGFGREAGMPLASSKRIAKIAFTGSTSTGRVIAQAAANNLIPATLELGGKSPNVFFPDVMAEDDGYLDKAIEGLVLFAFNQGEVCTCPSRALIHESIYDKFMERCLQRIAAIKQGNPLDTDTMIGAQQPGFSYSIVNNAGVVKATLNALAQKSQLRVLSNPSILVLDNHNATIQVGKQQPVRTGGATVVNGAVISESVTYRDTGVMLSVTPSVNSGGLITLSIAQQVTDVGEIDSATTQRAFLTRQIQSRVAVRSGETIVLGGMIRENESSGRGGVPLLSEIPVVGALFSTTTEGKERTELIVLLTPRALEGDDQVRAASIEMRQRIRSLGLQPLRDAMPGMARESTAGQ